MRPSDEMRPASVPADLATRHVVHGVAGNRLSVYRFNKRPAGDAPVLLWGHANGFAAGSYAPLLATLTDRAEVWAFDARGHGGSDIDPRPLPIACHVDEYASDLAAIVDHVRRSVGPDLRTRRRFLYAAHSFSGVAALRLLGAHGLAPWDSVLLFEPPIAASADVAEHALVVEISRALYQRAAKRRAEWPSAAAYAERLSHPQAFGRWRPDLLLANAHATTHARADGAGVTLACPPAVEAATYRMTENGSTFRALTEVSVPVHFVSAMPDAAAGAPSWAARMQHLAAARAPLGAHHEIKGAGHMMTFERPDECLDLLGRLIDDSLEVARP